MFTKLLQGTGLISGGSTTDRVEAALYVMRYEQIDVMSDNIR